MPACTAFNRHDPKTRVLLGDVFERAWEKVRAKHALAAEPRNEKAARQELAKRIDEAHENGERNPHTLELLAVRTFDRWTKPGDT
jgi:hypothetical protein